MSLAPASGCLSAVSAVIARLRRTLLASGLETESYWKPAFHTKEPACCQNIDDPLVLENLSPTFLCSGPFPEGLNFEICCNDTPRLSQNFQ